MSDKSLKLSINNHDLAEAFFEDSRLLGIMAPVKDYQFCWQLNNLLGVDFRINHEIEIRLQKKRRDYFFQFLNISSQQDRWHTICTRISMKGSTCYLSSNTLTFYGS